MQPFLSVVIPAYNEEKRITPTLERVCNYLSGQSWIWEVIVVSDGSTDRTVNIVRNLQARYPRLKLLVNESNHGKGYVVKQGMLEASGQLRLFMDADSSTPIQEIEKLLPYIRRSYDIVIGSLGVKGAQVDKSEFFWRVVAGKIGNILIQLIVLPGIQDTQRGFKLFTADAAKKIFPYMKIGGWGFDIEALALARKFSFSIKEVPVRWSHDEGSKISAFSYITVLYELVRIRWWLWTNYV